MTKGTSILIKAFEISQAVRITGGAKVFSILLRLHSAVGTAILMAATA